MKIKDIKDLLLPQDILLTKMIGEVPFSTTISSHNLSPYDENEVLAIRPFTSNKLEVIIN